MLRDILPPHLRKPAYAVYAAVGLVLGAIPTYCAAVDTAVPLPVVGLLAVYAYLGVAFGATASSNIHPTSKEN